ncbi:MAG TPA: formate C-acetyltransferase/glycerol dehydratase family glycyl radical enzyme, partial [Candidatus Atribacteria bacterium]|nr:formate C-acetyltransferase/glycerol dehydratase family glycyl radical enzyme [Candidatus Atribacteria bacterium]
MNERIEKLRQESLDTQPYISIQRAAFVTEAYKKYGGTVSIPVLRALAFRHLLENKSICIGEGELIVGERGEAPRATPTFPELCCHSLEDLELINNRKKIFFTVNQEVKEIQKEEIIPYWENRSMRSRIFKEMTPEWKDCYT